MSLIYGPAEPIAKPTNKPSNPGVTDGEPGYKKRTSSGAALPEKTRETNGGLKKPTKS